MQKRPEKEREREEERKRTGKVMQIQSMIRLEINPNISVTTLPGNVLNTPIKKQRWSNIKNI